MAKCCNNGGIAETGYTTPLRNTIMKRGRLSKVWASNTSLTKTHSRAPYKLGHLYRRYPARRFFGESCVQELTRNWHVHVDNYCNYIPGYCGGISLGDARDLDSMCQGIDLQDRPVLGALATDLERLYEFGKREFGYREPP